MIGRCARCTWQMALRPANVPYAQEPDFDTTVTANSGNTQDLGCDSFAVTQTKSYCKQVSITTSPYGIRPRLSTRGNLLEPT